MCLKTPGFLGFKVSYRIATEKLQESFWEAVESHNKATEKLQEG